MSYQTVYELAKEEQLLQRLAVASAEVARDVFVEGAGVANHDVRALLVPYAGPRTADWRRFAQEIALLLLFLNLFPQHSSLFLSFSDLFRVHSLRP